jgi:hypothetical protein
MTKIAFLFSLLSTVLVWCLPAAPAQAAGVLRTFVSATGSDSNNCANVATPCRHMAAAYAATAPNGEIYVLDPANYGSLTITGPVSIEGHGWASIAPAGVAGSAITINANPGDAINIIGVVLDGTGISNTNGINFNSGGTLTVRDSVIRNFPSSGINFAPASSSQSRLFVSNTLISDNGFSGISIQSSGPGKTTGALDHDVIDNNGYGLYVSASSQTVELLTSNSNIDNSAQAGVYAQGGDTSTMSNVILKNVTLNQSNIGVQLNSFSAAYFSQVTITNVAGFPIDAGVLFTLNATNNSASGDGTSHLSPVIGGSIGTWGPLQ